MTPVWRPRRARTVSSAEQSPHGLRPNGRGRKVVAELRAQSRITTYDWSKYDGETAVFLPSLMTPEQLEEGTRAMGVDFYTIPKILRRLWVNHRHPLMYLGTSLAVTSSYTGAAPNHGPGY